MQTHTLLAVLLILGTGACMKAPGPAGTAAPRLRLVASSAGSQAAYFAPYRAVVTHTHFDRTSKEYDANFPRLAALCRRERVAAFGVGSPWSPASTRDYRFNETTNRDNYYAARTVDARFYHRNEIAKMLADLNKLGPTFFYLDNESPKGRNGHLWYFNFAYQYPPWHDYSQDRPVQYYWNDPHIETNKVTGEPHRRRPYYEVISEQRAAGAVPVWAHPTSWWTSPDGAFVPNIAAELPSHLVLDGTAGGLTVSGYDPYHRDYRALYFMLLDEGYRIPAFAETDLTPVALDTEYAAGKHLIKNYIRMEAAPQSASALAAAAAHGDCYIGTGIAVAMEIDNVRMFGTVPAVKGRIHTLRVHLRPFPGEKECSRLEICSNGGEVVAAREHCAEGCYEFTFTDDGGYRYFTAGAFGEHEDHTRRQQDIHRFSMTNPVFLVPNGYAFQKPRGMTCTLEFRTNSFFRGWTFRLNGGPARTVTPGLKQTYTRIPAASVLELVSPAGRTERLYPYFEDAKVQQLISYLSEGGFRRDYPGLKPGEVPACAFDPRRWIALLDDIHAVL